MPDFEYHKASLEEIEQIGNSFCTEFGEGKHGVIPNPEYDRIFDHLAGVLRQHGTFSEGRGSADFTGSRYVDQIPWISIVPSDVAPSIALAAALEAVRSGHRPFAVQFDYYPDTLMVLPQNRVFTTFEEKALQVDG